MSNTSLISEMTSLRNDLYFAFLYVAYSFIEVIIYHRYFIWLIDDILYFISVPR